MTFDLVALVVAVNAGIYQQDVAEAVLAECRRDASEQYVEACFVELYADRATALPQAKIDSWSLTPGNGE